MSDNEDTSLMASQEHSSRKVAVNAFTSGKLGGCTRKGGTTLAQVKIRCYDLGRNEQV